MNNRPKTPSRVCQTHHRRRIRGVGAEEHYLEYDRKLPSTPLRPWCSLSRWSSLLARTRAEVYLRLYDLRTAHVHGGVLRDPSVPDHGYRGEIYLRRLSGTAPHHLRSPRSFVGFGYVLVSGYTFEKAAVVFLMVVYKVIDALADTYEAEFQRSGRLYLTGKSNAFRTILSVTCFLRKSRGDGRAS